MSQALRRTQSLSHWGAFTAVVEKGRLIRCEPFTCDSAPSPMIHAMPEAVYSPLRIARPAVRKSWLERRARSDGALRGREPFVEVSWEVALDLVAEEIARVRAEHGPTAIFGGSYGWSSAGRVNHARTLLRRFLFAGGGCVDQTGNYSFAAAMMLMPHVLGGFEMVSGLATDWRSIVGNTKRFVAFGGLALKNAQVAPGGVGDHNLAGWVREARAAGVEFIVVSPTRMDVPASAGARWIRIRPSTDTALLLAMAHVLITESRHDEAFLARHCVGFERLRDYILGKSDGIPKTPEWAAPITEVSAATTRELARELAGVRTMITMAWSLQRAHRGEQPYWMAVAFAAMLGQIGLPGGGVAFGHGSTAGIGLPRLPLPSPEMPAGVNPAKSAIPVARITDMLERPGAPYDFNGTRYAYPDCRMIYWAGGNPFHHHQDLNRLRRAWAKPQTVIVHEACWNAVARLADIVLPATTTLERADIGASSRDSYIFAMQQAIAPVGGARNDFDIFRELAARGGHEPAFTEGRDVAAWIRVLYEKTREGARAQGLSFPEFDAFWEVGYLYVPAPAKPFVLFEAFRADPIAHPLKTPSGRIELYSERIASFGYADMPAHPMWLEPSEWLGAPAAARHPLHLMTIQPPDRLHSQLDHTSLVRAHKVAGREKLWLSAADAKSRGIASGDLVRVFNDRGACLAGAEIDARIDPGVVVISTGAWYDGEADGSLERHGNPNVLTRDMGTSTLTQAPAALSLLVQIERFEGTPPPLRIDTPPALVAA